MIAATLIRGGQDLTIQNVLASIADESRPAWQRSALLRGAEVAVLGAAMPGTPPGRRGGPPAAAAAPCPTCPGGRAGPGGAYAFPQAPRTVPRRRALRLSREPAGLSAVASGTGDMATRATSVLAGIEWPGKPGAAEAIPAADGGRAAAVQRRAGGLQEYLPGLPPAGRPRPGAARTEPPRLRAGPRGARHPRAHSSQRQGGSRRADAACRIDVERRADCRRVDLHPPRVGPAGDPRGGGDGQGRPRADGRPHAPLDPRRAHQDGRRRPWRAAAVVSGTRIVGESPFRARQ